MVVFGKLLLQIACNAELEQMLDISAVRKCYQLSFIRNNLNKEVLYYDITYPAQNVPGIKVALESAVGGKITFVYLEGKNNGKRMTTPMQMAIINKCFGKIEYIYARVKGRHAAKNFPRRLQPRACLFAQYDNRRRSCKV